MKVTKTYETVPIVKLVSYARNAREHNAKQVAQIRASFREFGTLNPCIVDEDYTLIDGHGRLLAAQEEGLKELALRNCARSDRGAKKAYRLADNKIAENSEVSFMGSWLRSEMSNSCRRRYAADSRGRCRCGGDEQ